MDVSISNQQTQLPIEAARLEQAARGILDEAGYAAGRLSIAVVDDATIHALNRRHLAHDYPTDVLSFPLDAEGDRLEGEVVVSAETALANAAEYGWPAENELLLYVIHGTLHLTGYGDKTDDEARAMRDAEARWLRACGVAPPEVAPPEGASQR